MWGVTIDLVTTESCHYILPLIRGPEEVNFACTSSNNFEKGDIILYRRKGRWLGPRKFEYQDGKVICVQHGSALIRVSSNRIVQKVEYLEEENKNGSITEESNEDAESITRRLNF